MVENQFRAFRHQQSSAVVGVSAISAHYRPGVGRSWMCSRPQPGTDPPATKILYKSIASKSLRNRSYPKILSSTGPRFRCRFSADLFFTYVLSSTQPGEACANFTDEWAAPATASADTAMECTGACTAATCYPVPIKIVLNTFLFFYFYLFSGRQNMDKSGVVFSSPRLLQLIVCSSGAG